MMRQDRWISHCLLAVVVMPCVFNSKLRAQIYPVTPPTGWCAMAHCDAHMDDFVPLGANSWFSDLIQQNTPPTQVTPFTGVGVGAGLGCVSNGTNAACSYQIPFNTSPSNAVVIYGWSGTQWQATGHTGSLLDANTWGSAPIIDEDGNVIIGDDANIFKFNNTGGQVWSVATPNPGLYGNTNSGGTAGGPVSLVPTPYPNPNGGTNGIVSATRQSVDVCQQNASVSSAPFPCILYVTVLSGGSGYTANQNTGVTFSNTSGCPGVSGIATSNNSGVITQILVNQPASCTVPPTITGLGNTGTHPASWKVQLLGPAPLAVYAQSKTTGTASLVSGYGYYLMCPTACQTGSQDGYLQSTSSSPPAWNTYYVTVNTPCVSTDTTHANRVYVSTQLGGAPAAAGQTLPALLWALDIRPNAQLPNLPIAVAWTFPLTGPSGASPLCVSSGVVDGASHYNNVYFDGTLSGQSVIYGVQDLGGSASELFAYPVTYHVTANFAVDPRIVNNVNNGFWYGGNNDPYIHHLSLSGVTLNDDIDISALLTNSTNEPHSLAPTPPSGANYWMRGEMTTYAQGSPTTPYMYLSASDWVPGVCSCSTATGVSCKNANNKQALASYLLAINLAENDVQNGNPYVWSWPLFVAGGGGNSTSCSDAIEGNISVAVVGNAPSIVTAASASGVYFLGF